MQQAIKHLLNRHNLSASQMQQVMRTVMKGEATDAQIAGFMVALRMKGETIAEITAAVTVMRELVTPVNLQLPHLIDIVGSGGDNLHTFNISTTVSFVVAAAGGNVAKHGNRAVSSQCGSADVLEAAGIQINLNAMQVAQCVTQLGIGFMFAPLHHSAMRHALAARQQLGMRSLFNLLGPLTNPAQTPYQLIGVFADEWLMPVAKVLKNLHSQHVMVVHSQDGMDEMSIVAPSTIVEVKGAEISKYQINPARWGLQHDDLHEIVVKDVAQSLQLMLSVLHNQAGAARDIVILNAAAAIYCADLCDSLDDGVTLATQCLKNGCALQKFTSLKQLTHEMKNYAP